MFGNYYDIPLHHFLHLTMSFTVGSLRVQSQIPRAFCSVTSLPPGDVLLGACRKRTPSQLTVHASRFCVFLLVMTDTTQTLHTAQGTHSTGSSPVCVRLG
jgi:hypothetical protein